MTNPYARYIEGRDLLGSLAQTPERYRRLLAGWTPARFQRRHAPGKWSAGQIMVHLAQTEMVFGVRARFAATSIGYVAQPFEQDDWMRLEQDCDGRMALEAYCAMRRVNLGLYRSFTPELLERPFTHPERGPLPLRWILELTAGHELHHLAQVEQAAASA